MLVLADVDVFKTHVKGTVLTSMNEFQDMIAALATRSDIDSALPFIFLLKVRKGLVSYHIIDWKTGVSHTPANHKQFATTGTFHNEPVTIVGFYSRQNGGIYTPHSSFLHLHVINASKTVVGHVDSLSLEDYEISLP